MMIHLHFKMFYARILGLREICVGELRHSNIHVDTVVDGQRNFNNLTLKHFIVTSI